MEDFEDDPGSFKLQFLEAPFLQALARFHAQALARTVTSYRWVASPCAQFSLLSPADDTRSNICFRNKR